MSKKYLITILLTLVALVNVWLAKTISPVVQVPETVANDLAEYIIPSPTASSTTSQSEVYKVVKVIDGDTIEVEVSGVLKRVRYIGIDTPENPMEGKAAECFATEATLRNQQLVEGQMVRLVKDVSETDKYGRLLRYVYVGDEFINLSLIKDGYASSVTFPPDVSQIEVFKAAEQEAKLAKKGLWGEVCIK